MYREICLLNSYWILTRLQKQYEIFIVHFMLMTISLSRMVAMSSKTYEAKLELFNKVSIYEPLETKHTGSLLGCSILCDTGCHCFNINLQTDTYLLYNSCNPTHMTVSESGWRFFTDSSLEPIGEYVQLHYLQKIAKKKYIYLTLLYNHMNHTKPAP